MKRPSTDVLVLCGLLLLFAFLSLRMAAPGAQLPDDKDRPRRSVSSARPGGWKALYLLLQRQGVPVEKIERSPREWPGDLRVLVIGDAYGGARWTQKEVDQALAWAGKGRTLVLLAGRSSALLDRIGLRVGDTAAADKTLFPLQPAPFLGGVDGVLVPGKGRWQKLPAGAVSLFADERPAVAFLRRGGGTILAVADAGIADNRHITEADNARFLLAALRSLAGDGGRVGFDEYHQGFQEADGFFDAIGRPGQLVVWQIVALALLLAYSASRRFGLPRPLPAPPRVSSEYVASLADLYRRARAADAALEGVYLRFWRDLCRAVTLPYDADTDEVVRRAARSVHGIGGAETRALEERLRRVVNECEAKIESGKVRDADLLPLARELEALRKELGLGGDDRETAGART
uniref:DUF4350 domain-containing protein n=1 Tax=uncultured Armatimonadetes bacterium TaxID=157466 RepID=A0A6J4JM16_9BACT|nr:hypothetical protein AVDCRST_MAG63-3692 [uncultured Armatimonadetes bacterium]